MPGWIAVARVWWCGAGRRSSTLATTPWRASSAAANRPDGPAPMTTTSGSVPCVADDRMCRLPCSAGCRPVWPRRPLCPDVRLPPTTCERGGRRRSQESRRPSLTTEALSAGCGRRYLRAGRRNRCSRRRGRRGRCRRTCGGSAGSSGTCGRGRRGLACRGRGGCCRGRGRGSCGWGGGACGRSGRSACGAVSRRWARTGTARGTRRAGARRCGSGAGGCGGGCAARCRAGRRVADDQPGGHPAHDQSGDGGKGDRGATACSAGGASR